MTPEVLSVVVVLVSAVIAACVALLVGMLSFIAAVLTVNGQIKATQLDLEERYRKTIFDKRLEAYAEVWRITAALSSRRLIRIQKNSCAPVKMG